MKILPSLLPALLACACSLPIASAADPADESPVCVISEEVKVNVDRELSLIDGRYMLQYVETRDPGNRSTVWFRYPVFVPKDVTDFVDLVELTQLKVTVDSYAFPPKSVEVADPDSVEWIHPVPDDATIAWFTFELPRDVGSTRFEVGISYAQPHYRYRGKSLAAYLPWMPDFEPFRMKLWNFTVTFEALPGVTFERAGSNKHVLDSSPTRFSVRPVHRENIAVAVQVARSKTSE